MASAVTGIKKHPLAVLSSFIALLALIIVLGLWAHHSSVIKAAEKQRNLQAASAPHDSPITVGKPFSVNVPQDTDSSSVTPAATQPQTLLDLSGSGSQQTTTFTPNVRWTITYTYDCSDAGGRGNFQFDLNNTDGTRNSDVGANELGASGSATDYYYDGGEHYLSINSECSWHVVVKE